MNAGRICRPDGFVGSRVRAGRQGDEMHLGELLLECSRSGAAAAALWLTLELFPLTPDGLGAVLRPGRRATLKADRRHYSDAPAG